MEQQTFAGFKRKSRVGFNIIGFETVGQVRCVKVLDIGVFEKKDGDTIDYADVIDLMTGEEARMWLDGSLRYNMKAVYDKNESFGFGLEIRFDGKKETETMIGGKLQALMINTYSIWELDLEAEKSHN